MVGLEMMFKSAQEVKPSTQVTLDHFVMVRIHARQPAQDQVFTDHHQKRWKDILASS
jgi:hypothetical protein